MTILDVKKLKKFIKQDSGFKIIPSENPKKLTLSLFDKNWFNHFYIYNLIHYNKSETLEGVVAYDVEVDVRPVHKCKCFTYMINKKLEEIDFTIEPFWDIEFLNIDYEDLFEISIKYYIYEFIEKTKITKNFLLDHPSKILAKEYLFYIDFKNYKI